MLPSFIIAGGVKCGTSSLYRYLNEHPQILPCKTKEPQYFNIKKKWKRISKKSWYESQFPLIEGRQQVEAGWLDLNPQGQMTSSTFVKERMDDTTYITGEASASTFANGYPDFLKSFHPEMKVILLFREATQRFVSHYNMFKRFKLEGRPTYQNLPDFEEFVTLEIQKFQQNKNTKLLHQGLYVNLLDKWFKHFGTEQVRMIKSADLLAQDSRNKILKDLLVFLNLKEHEFSKEAILYNKAFEKESNITAEEKLHEFYKPFNEQLKEKYRLVL